MVPSSRSARRLVLLLVMVVAVLMAALAACGLDENGILPGDASIPDTPVIPDAPSDIATEPLPSTCVDASACIDASIPDGWTLIAFAQAPAACPANFDPSQYVDNLGLEAGACTCGCTPTGRYSCAGSVQLGSNCGNCSGGVGGCGTKTSFTAGDDAGCFATGATNPDIAFGSQPSVTAVGVGCDASASGQGSTSNPVAVCIPQCTADYCGSIGSFKKCIISTETSGCPSPFVRQDTIGSPGSVSVTCAGCTCTASQVGNCIVSVQYFGNTTCAGSANGTVTLPSCTATGGTNIGSFSYTPTVPTVQCTPSAGDGGVEFGAPITVCCLP